MLWFKIKQTNKKLVSPVARKLHSVGLGLSVFSDDHLIKEPAAASAFAIMSNPHPADLADGNSFDYELIQLDTRRRGVEIKHTADEFKRHITIVGRTNLVSLKHHSSSFLPPTFPFSNLFMLFLQLTSQRSPVSP